MHIFQKLLILIISIQFTGCSIMGSIVGSKIDKVKQFTPPAKAMKSAQYTVILKNGNIKNGIFVRLIKPLESIVLEDTKNSLDTIKIDDIEFMEPKFKKKFKLGFIIGGLIIDILLLIIIVPKLGQI